MRKLSGFVLLAILFACGPMQPAFAQQRIELQPKFVYLYRNYEEPKYSTFQEAYALAKAEVESTKDPVSGMSTRRMAGATPSGITFSGHPVLSVVIEHLENGTYKSATTTGGYVTTRVHCPSGFAEEWDPSSSSPAWIVRCVGYAYPEPCDTCDAVGNPIIPSAKIKLQREVDYRSAGPGGLEFVRTYRSDRNGWENNYSITGTDLRMGPKDPPTGVFEPPAEPARAVGCYWGFGGRSGKLECFAPMASGAANDFALRRGNGNLVKFGSATDFAPAAHVNDRWTPVFEAGTKIANDVYNAANNSTERYGLNGLIQQITDRNGQVTRFAYAPFDGPVTSISPQVVLTSVTDHFGRKLTFKYNAEGRLETMTTPANEVFTYRYDEASGGGSSVGNLTSVTYPDQRKRIYWYNEPANTSGQNRPFALTGITDENGVRYATFKYDQGGYALSTEHAGEVNKYRISGSALYQDHEYRYVVDPLGAEVESAYAMTQGGLRLARKQQPAGAGSPTAYEFRTYDANGNLDTLTSFNGTVTKYTYDLARNLELTRTEAFGLPEQRKTTTEWHSTYRIPNRIAEPKRLTTYDYFPNGDVKTRSVQATTDESGALGFAAAKVGTVSTWTHTYNSNGQLETVTGPRAGGIDKTTYTYDPVTGDLQSIKNAAGHVTTFGDYDLNGRARLVTAPNRMTTRMSYSPRGWLESRTVSDGTTSLTTTYGYDNVGQVTTITNPDNTVITYVYDDAHRLTDVFDSAGNKIHYVLNNMGSRLSEEVTDPSGTLRRQVTNQYDILNRLQVKTGGAQ
jgi:YD repeat-containing protein